MIGRPASLLTILLLILTTADAAGLSPSVHRRLTEIREQMADGEQQEGLARLERLLARAGGDRYTEAVIRQHLGYAYLGGHQPVRAYGELSAALDSEVLPEAVNRELQRLLAQVATQLDRPKAAVAHLEAWLQGAQPLTSEDHAMAAQVYYAAGKRDTAISSLERAISLSSTAPETWQRSLLAMYLEARRYRQARRLLHRLIAIYPVKASYWRHLAQLEAARGRHDRALALMAAAYRRNLLEASELVGFAQMYAAVGIPERAARLLSEWRGTGALRPGKARLRTEAELWLMARERQRAMEILQPLSDANDAKAAYTLGMVLLEEGRWSEAAATLEKAAKSRELGGKRQEHAAVLLGIAATRAESNDTTAPQKTYR
jgi:tetratricopeptide (TPR) repeat protein